MRKDREKKKRRENKELEKKRKETGKTIKKQGTEDRQTRVRSEKRRGKRMVKREDEIK